MMVPREYMHRSMQKHRQSDPDEKTLLRKRRSTQDVKSNVSRSPSAHDVVQPVRLQPASSPVRIPSHKVKRLDPAPVQRSSSPTLLSTCSSSNRKKITPGDILSATTIQVRRRAKGRPSQRLPDCDHVSSFSKLLLDDVPVKDDKALSSSLSNPQYGGLFGNIEELVEGQMFVGSEGVDASMLSPRSVSSESMPSVASPDDYLSSEVASASLHERRPSSASRPRQIANSEDAASSHPLLASDGGPDEPRVQLPDSACLSLRPKRRSAPPNFNSSLKSSLTASLRALRSAAESISTNIAAISTSSVQPDDFAVFTIQPSLTDDKRPLPTSSPPSPALRRYLNPQKRNLPPESPQHLHFWHEERHSTVSKLSSAATNSRTKKKSKKGTKGPIQLPPVVQLQSCTPPAVRTAHASSPPIWLAPGGQPTNKNTAHHNLNGGVFLPEPGQARQREPRENRDFLRVLVAEMNMRRAGKLERTLPPRGHREDDRSGDGAGMVITGAALAGTKAALWLPPVNEDFGGQKGEARLPPEVRWRARSVDDCI